MKRILVLGMLMAGLSLTAEAHVTGTVLDDQGEILVGANVFWAGTTIGVATDADGRFEIEPVKGVTALVTSYMGYRSDTTVVKGGHAAVTIVLMSDLTLNEVEVTERRMAVLRSRYSALDVQTLTGEELCKAACCNLSESFETSASVDVAYADAATGAKQIRLLGLSGTYVQMMSENIPSVRGLAQAFGMEYIPGPWMQAIQVSKGTSSVVNGYEALTGQINVDYLHPDQADPLAINALISKDLKAELNITGGWVVNEHAQTALLLHAQGSFMGHDENGDGFMNMPTGYHVNMLNRWNIKTDGIWNSKVLVRALYDRRNGGQTPAAQATVADPYRIDLRTRRIDGFWKNGLIFDKDLGTSLGLIAAASYHDQTNIYGPKRWDAKQANAYFNAIFQSNFENPELDPEDKHEHKLTAGVSFNYDQYWETLSTALIPSPYAFSADRKEFTPGIFAEYTYNYMEKVTLLVGVREDWSSRYGFFTTPRMNIRYAPFEWWTLRASVGLGYRSPNLLSDNSAYLSSNRVWYNLSGEQEKALNTGATMSFEIPMGKRTLTLSGEYYYTQFLAGVITDIDRDAHAVYFYNLAATPGLKSFSHNWQVEANMEVLRGWTWTLAFRYTDVRQSSFNMATGDFQLRERPLQNRFKGLITTSYQTPLKKWQFDLTAQFNGPGRMPDGYKPVAGDTQYYVGKDGATYHTWYPQLLAQVTKYFRTASIYLGAENMTNFTQRNPILGARNEKGYIDPASADFDATQVWAPIHGWKLYLGFRWNLEKDDN